MLGVGLPVDVGEDREVAARGRGVVARNGEADGERAGKFAVGGGGIIHGELAVDGESADRDADNRRR